MIDLRTARRPARLAAWTVLLLGLAPRPCPAGELRPLSAERGRALEELVDEAAALRGLEPPATLRAGAIDRPGLAARLRVLVDREMPAEEVEPLQRALRLFGLLPEGLDLRREYVRLLAAQVAAYFDPREETLVLVDGGDAPAGAGDLAAAVESSVMIHELAHLLQHEHFDLERFLSGDLASDVALAAAALVEGDATLVMMSHLLGFELERFPLADRLLLQALDDPDRAREMVPGLGDEAGSGTPAFLREGLLFPYLRGLVFCAEVRRVGGQKLLDHAFRHDPPRSSEQILHPAKWLGERDAPVELELPDPSGVGGIGPLRTSGQLGEAQIRVLLADRLRSATPETLHAAAAGWGGDRFALYGEGDGEALGWLTEWDSEADAEEFLALSGAAFADAVVLGDGERRVSVVLRAPEGAAVPLASALLVAPGSREGATSIDLAALDIGPHDVPAPLAEEELERALAGPDRPAWLAGLEGARGAPGEARGRSGPAVLEDGVVRLDAPALEIPLPDADRWRRLNADDLGIDVAPSLVVQDPGSGATLTVLAIQSPVPTWIEAVAVGVDASLQGSGVEVVERTFGETDRRRYLALETVVRSRDAAVRMVQRIFVDGPWVLTVQGTAPEAAWKSAEPVLRAFLEGVAFRD